MMKLSVIYDSFFYYQNWEERIMIQLFKDGVFLVNGEIKESGPLPKEESKKQTLAYNILQAHNKSKDPNKLKITFDSLASHDITYVGIVQTARVSGLKEFPVPYVMTNCHNSLCAVGGTINEDDHVFGLSAAKKYGGIYVPANQSVIHSYVREEMTTCGGMILGSDSHTRYGALGTMGVGEGGPELVKQLLKNTSEFIMFYDTNHIVESCSTEAEIRLERIKIKNVRFIFLF
jgi:aconitate hydratase